MRAWAIDKGKDMARKGLLALALAALVAGGAFAQFSVGGGVENLSLPTIEVGYGIGNMDILLGVNFRIQNVSREFADGLSLVGWVASQREHEVGIYAGVAPRVMEVGNWTLSLPLLARFRFGGTGEAEFFDGTIFGQNTTTGAGSSFLGLDFRAGGRAAYGFSENWSLNIGFLINAVSWTQTRQYMWRVPYGSTVSNPATDGTTLAFTQSALNVFQNAVVTLGISYRF